MLSLFSEQPHNSFEWVLEIYSLEFTGSCEELYKPFAKLNRHDKHQTSNKMKKITNMFFHVRNVCIHCIFRGTTNFDAMSGLYTCITCRVGFANLDLQRGHYKTDWHRYNLKRKVAELPPVTADTFQQKVLAQREQVKLV